MSNLVITVGVFDSWHYEAPQDFEDFVMFINKLMASIPPENVPDTRIELSSNYESSSVNLKIYYLREETDAERMEREQAAIRYVQQRALETEMRERQALAELKAKYEGNP